MVVHSAVERNITFFVYRDIEGRVMEIGQLQEIFHEKILFQVITISYRATLLNADNYNQSFKLLFELVLI